MKIDGEVTDWFKVGINVNFQDRSDGDIQPNLGTIVGIKPLRLSPYASYKDEEGNLTHRPMGPTQYYNYNFDFNRQFMELERGIRC